MVRLFFLACQRYVRLWWLGLSPQPGARFSLRRAATLLLLLPVLGLVQAIHWLGFVLDELFFRGYRQVTIVEPVFILGVPRSGTTHLHSVIAQDDQFTSFTLWECLFGLSVSARYFWKGLGRIDRIFGGPLKALLSWAVRRWTTSLDDVHPLNLDSPEEDYLALMPIFSSFILVVAFPAAPWLWRMGYFDRDMSEHEQRDVLRFYRSCLQRHLYVHGPDKRILSKNAAFASLAQALAEAFPDSRIICCQRDPVETLPSQLSSLSGAIRAFDGDVEFFNKRFLELFEYYYPHLDEVVGRLPARRAVWVPIESQRRALVETVTAIYRQLELPASEDFLVRVGRLAALSREHRSRHTYTPEEFGFTRSFLQERFAGRQ